MSAIKLIVFTTIIITNSIIGRTKINIIQQNEINFTFNVERSVKTHADLKPNYIFIGLSSKKYPKVKIISHEKKKSTFMIKNNENQLFEWINIQKHQNLYVAVLKINPILKDNEFLKKLTLQIEYNSNASSLRNANKNERQVLSNKIINWRTAKEWFQKDQAARKYIEIQTQGLWLNFAVTQDGIKSIPYNKIKAIYNDIDLVDPRSIKLFSPADFGREKKYEINTPIPENFIELPIIIEGEEDGIFDPEDYIIFYGRGPSGFDNFDNTIQWSQNLYFTSSNYWVYIPNDNLERGKRIQLSSEISDINLTIDYGISYYHSEIDLINPEQSGLGWFGTNVQSNSTQIISIESPNVKSEVDCYIELKLKGFSINGSSTTFHSIDLKANSLSQNNIGSTASWTGNGTRTISGLLSGEALNNEINNFFISNISQDNNSSPMIDFLSMRYGRKLIFDSNQIDFFSPLQNSALRFSFLNELKENIIAFDITYPEDPKTILIKDRSKIEVQSPIDRFGRYVVLDKNKIDLIDNLTFLGEINFSRLRNYNTRADYIIIGPKDFFEASEPLLDLRSPAIYASLEDIYKEFSGGNKDPIAIRNFVQWTQENWIAPAPIHLLLLGDSGYDYRNINGLSAIVVPTIQVQSYLSYPSDDRFSTIYGNLPELSTGRFPAKNLSQVESFIEKINFIETEGELGPWRQRVTLIADDPARPEPNHGGIATGKSHTINSETLSEIIPTRINVEKIYMLEYPEVSDASAYGVTKPDATEALFKTIKNGTAIINYIGHGSAFQLAQEKLLHLNRGDLENIKTDGRLPLWIVGTCSFGHFDDPLSESFGEELIRYPMDAASAVISTCRPITVTGNERYTQDIFEELFSNPENINKSIGICLQSIKNGSNESEYFHLFGDPALKVPIVYSSFDNSLVEPDTLKTLQTANIKINQNIITNGGTGVIVLKDADRDVTRSYNIASTSQTLSYKLPGRILFRGNFSFTSNEKNIKIRVPQDISYSENPSKILIYLNDNDNETSTVISPISIVGGGTNLDDKGPIINFKSETGRAFRNGDHKNPQEKIIVQISDPLGINLTKELGHSIILENLNTNESYDITDNFFYNSNSITTGEILLDQFTQNENYFMISAWDNANNPSEKTIRLFSTKDSKLKLFNVYNFPNPFSDQTKFTFEITSDAEVSIFIYTLGGKKIKHINSKYLKSGFNSIEWNGQNEFGRYISNGTYLYKIFAKNNNNDITHLGKLAKYK